MFAEAIIDEHATGRFPMDLNIEMLVCASGRERTAATLRALLEQAGFRIVQAAPLAGITGLVESVIA